MRITQAHQFWAAACILAMPAAGRAQTEEVQREVDALLWRLRLWRAIEDATGLPPLVALLTLLALVAALAAGVWLAVISRRRAKT